MADANDEMLVAVAHVAGDLEPFALRRPRLRPRPRGGRFQQGRGGGCFTSGIAIPGPRLSAHAAAAEGPFYAGGMERLAARGVECRKLRPSVVPFAVPLSIYPFRFLKARAG